MSWLLGNTAYYAPLPMNKYLMFPVVSLNSSYLTKRWMIGGSQATASTATGGDSAGFESSRRVFYLGLQIYQCYLILS